MTDKFYFSKQFAKSKLYERGLVFSKREEKDSEKEEIKSQKKKKGKDRRCEKYGPTLI